VHTRAVFDDGENRNVLWPCWESSPESSIFQHIAQSLCLLNYPGFYSVKSSLNYTAAVEYAGNIATLKKKRLLLPSSIPVCSDIAVTSTSY